MSTILIVFEVFEVEDFDLENKSKYIQFHKQDGLDYHMP